MKALLLKDCRVNQLVLGVGIVLLAGPPLVGVFINLYSDWRFGVLSNPWPELLLLTSQISLAISLLTVVMLGGNAVAGERADRSAEFLAYLPPSRRAIITSKAVLAIGTGIFIWVINLIVVYGYALRAPGMSQEWIVNMNHSCTLLFPSIAATWVVMFGVAWFCSSMIASPTIATGLGFVPPAIVGSLLLHFYGPNHPEIGLVYRTICLTVGVLGFVGGIGYYLRRVEP